MRPPQKAGGNTTTRLCLNLRRFCFNEAPAKSGGEYHDKTLSKLEEVLLQ